ncbi:hypothetical protein N7463_004754 [Penicillium fimorum]|uniref:HNH nuclease domain-containing protein n=1 Tax=Penicillium fimorum TaxID=1882269 RepID=A0A9W9XR80_9EURO|nr:hypothetical protein N7463_004754 [Penicillium fimorum]
MAHIVPSKLNRTRNSHLEEESCWVWLEEFWGRARVEQWQARVLRDAIDRVYNLITMEMQARAYWDRASFVLRPVSINAAKTEMHIAFHWLPFVKDGPSRIPAKRTEGVLAKEHIFSDPYYKHRMELGDGVVLLHTRMGKPIMSGHVFKMTTDNKKERPLPLIELLQLKWNLYRIAELQGAGEDDDSDDDSDGDPVPVPVGPRRRTPSRGGPSLVVALPLTHFHPCPL